ncbi:head maturation protease, ClpP-related, partial [Pseudomonas viridiflava]|uniref:head maturation protease, ClpP-related n=1 Tax=Pseudomonas viridiflava TaxID=33069 RepID=UPI0013CEC9E0
MQAAAQRGTAVFEIFGDIGAWGITAKQFAQDLKALGDVSLIDLRVNSPGGDVFDGIAIYNMLRTHPARVEGSVMGLAASMGSVILMASNVIRMPANSMLMIHKPWGIQGGDADDMRRYADLLDKVEGSL